VTTSGRHGQVGAVPAADAPDAAADPARPGETATQRDDRNLAELLQELRVAGLGVQIIFGFLLALPFSARFSTLRASQRDLYVAALSLTALATALLLGPVAYHRLVFRQRLKRHLVHAANRMAIAGLATVALLVCSVMLLVLSHVAGGTVTTVITAATVCLYGGLWFAVPLARRRGRPAGSSPGGASGRGDDGEIA
jgi:uncharacterized protein DUF6328